MLSWLDKETLNFRNHFNSAEGEKTTTDDIWKIRRSAEFSKEDTNLLIKATLNNFSGSLQAYIALVKKTLTATKTTHIFTAMQQWFSRLAKAVSWV